MLSTASCFPRNITLNIYFIRHAESEFNVSGIVQGHLDADLSPNGLDQAKSLAKHLKDIKFEYCYTSDLIRASKTADYVIEINQNKECIKYSKEKLLRERNFGEAQGQKKSFMIEKSLESNVKFEDYVPKGAESRQDIIERWRLFLKKLCNEMSGNTANEIFIMVVSHGAFMRESIKSMLREYNCDFKYDLNELEKSAPNTSVTQFRVNLSVKSKNEWSINFIEFESFCNKNHLENISETFCDL
ncbi:unnamed protein product [Brachionus calyciflorus]|uniref:Uncharacterized protein n=1 Tax=Brachionus calyciflorus TaxID=104777 RepID=A0A814J831_9BILA|nr:unnamed protein product [Brachionus calyciflorus]